MRLDLRVARLEQAQGGEFAPVIVLHIPRELSPEDRERTLADDIKLMRQGIYITHDWFNAGISIPPPPSHRAQILRLARERKWPLVQIAHSSVGPGERLWRVFAANADLFEIGDAEMQLNEIRPVNVHMIYIMDDIDDEEDDVE